MTSAVQGLEGQTAVAPNGQRSAAEVEFTAAKAPKARPQAAIALPAATCVTLAIHYFATRHALSSSKPYWLFLFGVLGIGLITAALYPFFLGLRRRIENLGPIFAAGIVMLGAWELITSGFRLLPLPYFPAPDAVLNSMINDRALLFDSTWHSLVMLLTGYFLGVAAGLVCGVCIGWSSSIRYWGMPVLKVIGPIPATAWIPLAMVVSPSTSVSSAGLIALAVWFPVTMLTASGISNTRSSYIDVARTLGANETYLIFRVAIPAAIPNVFVGLFMGLGASFLTLVVAESVGVKSGLGWYVSWAQGWAEYGKVYGALVIMAVFFSSIMTLLFKVRDILLVWQKGFIKW